jgi:cardiolipin synthase (CMP-forming)
MRTVEEKQLKQNSTGWWNAPNAVSLTRIFLAPVIAWAIWADRSTLALACFALAAATDFLDGFLARTAQATTRLGVYLDPIADKILLSVVYIALGFTGRVPLWFVAIVFGRDLALIVASAIAMKVSSYNNYKPTIWGKISTFWQIVAAVAAIASATSVVTQDIVYFSALATLWSAVHYTYRGIAFFVVRDRPRR